MKLVTHKTQKRIVKKARCFVDAVMVELWFSNFHNIVLKLCTKAFKHVLKVYTFQTLVVCPIQSSEGDPVTILGSQKVLQIK